MKITFTKTTTSVALTALLIGKASDLSLSSAHGSKLNILAKQELLPPTDGSLKIDFPEKLRELALNQSIVACNSGVGLFPQQQYKCSESDINALEVTMGGTVATIGFPDIGLQGFAPKLAVNLSLCVCKP